MNFKYRAVHLGDEKTWDNESTATAEPDLAVDKRSLIWATLRSRGIWIAHAVLLLLSSGILFSAMCIRTSTLDHVRAISAWSPAAGAVEYQSVKYNISTKGNRFVGAGPEVDKAWREISYDSKDPSDSIHYRYGHAPPIRSC